MKKKAEVIDCQVEWEHIMMAGRTFLFRTPEAKWPHKEEEEEEWHEDEELEEDEEEGEWNEEDN